MTTSASTSPAQPSSEETGRLLAHGIHHLDTERAEAYAGLATLSTVKAASLTRERARLVQKYGAQDARVIGIDARLAHHAGFRRDLHLAQVNAATPAPAVDARSYVFHGFVRTPQREPLPGLTVALYSEKGAWIRELGYGCSDEHGYFLLRYSGDKTEKPPSSETGVAENQLRTAASPPAAGAAAGARTDEPAASRQAPAAEIRVYDAKQTLLHREAEPLAPALGRVDFRLIIIGPAGGRCSPPPGATDDPPPVPAPPTRSPAEPPAPAKVPGQVARPAPLPPSAAAPGSPATRSTPLENIKGIGPVTAAKLRAAGVPDLEAFLATPGEKLVRIAGFDAEVIKRQQAEAAQTTGPATTARSSADVPAADAAKRSATAQPAATRKKATPPKSDP